MCLLDITRNRVYIRSLIVVILLSLLSISLFSASIIESTFRESKYLLDHSNETYAISGDVQSKEQSIVLNLKKIQYIKNIKILWHSNYYSKNYHVFGSTDYLHWNPIKKNINAKKYSKNKNNIMNSINAKNNVAQFVKIVIPKKSKIKSDSTHSIMIGKIDFNFTKYVKPKILSKAVKRPGNDSVIIMWKSDYPTIGQVRYGLLPHSIADIVTEYSFTKDHSVTLRNLKKGTKYYYQMINQLPDKKYFTSPLLKFKTKGVPLPKVNRITVVNKSYNKVILSIVPNIKTSVKIEYRNGKKKIKKTSKTKLKHRLVLKDLRPLQEYRAKITLRDRFNKTFQTNYLFQTGEYNIALNKKVEGTFNSRYIADIFQLTGNVIRRVTDGSFDYKSGMAVSTDPLKSNQFCIIDFKKKEKITMIITYWRALAYPYLYFIYYSNDKISWKRMDKLVNLKRKKPKFIKGSGIPMIIGETDVKNIQARYIKIFVPQGTPYYKKYKLYTFLQLLECKVYSEYR